MSRRFDGVNDEVVWTPGAVAGTGAITIAMIAKINNANGDWGSCVNLENAGVCQMELTRRGTTDSPSLTRESETTLVDAPFTWRPADGWTLIAVSKTSGSVLPSFTKYPIGGSPTHGNGGATIANSDAINTIGFGLFEGAGDPFDGWLAAVGIWDIALSTAERESLVDDMTRDNWASGLSADWIFDELDVFQTDWASGGSATRTSIVGTTDDADDPAGWEDWAGAAPGVDPVRESKIRRSRGTAW